VISRVSPWLPHEGVPPLAPGEVQVWRAHLDTERARAADIALLSPDERRRAARFHFDRDRAQYVSARATLRMLLGSYLGVGPGAVELQYSARGKPALGGALTTHPLRFNVAHSRGIGLFAVALDRAVGVDVEWVRADLEVTGLARRCFSPGEAAAILAAPTGLRHRLFFACWTRKEAFLKARGDGLSLALHQVDVLDRTSYAPRLRTRWDPDEAHRWQLLDLELGAAYAGALSVGGTACRVQCRQWRR
jgi:4'-phosphopantetheinyl transferase